VCAAYIALLLSNRGCARLRRVVPRPKTAPTPRGPAKATLRVQVLDAVRTLRDLRDRLDAARDELARAERELESRLSAELRWHFSGVCHAAAERVEELEREEAKAIARAGRPAQRHGRTARTSTLAVSLEARRKTPCKPASVQRQCRSHRSP
jgi:hypothetical protein